MFLSSDIIKNICGKEFKAALGRLKKSATNTGISNYLTNITDRLYLIQAFYLFFVSSNLYVIYLYVFK